MQCAILLFLSARIFTLELIIRYLHLKEGCILNCTSVPMQHVLLCISLLTLTFTHTQTLTHIFSLFHNYRHTHVPTQTAGGGNLNGSVIIGAKTLLSRHYYPELFFDLSLWNRNSFGSLIILNSSKNP